MPAMISAPQPEAAEAGDDHRRIVIGDRIVDRRRARMQAGQQQRFRSGEQHRRCQHGGGADQRGEIAQFRRQRPYGHCGAEQDEAELAGGLQRQPEA